MQNENNQKFAFPARRFLIVTALFWCAQYTYTAFLAPWLEGLQIAAQLIGTITGAYGFSQFLFRIPLGIYADNKGKHRPVILAGLILLIIPGILLRVSRLPSLILLARFLAGASASTWVSFTVFFQNALNAETNRKMGTIVAANSTGLLTSALISTLFIDIIGMNGLFLLSSIFSFVALLLFISVPEMALYDMDNKKDIKLTPLHKTIFQKDLLSSAALKALMQLLVSATALTFSANIVMSRGLPNAYLGVLSAIYTGAGLLAQAFIAKRTGSLFSDRFIIILGFIFLGTHAAVLPHVYNAFSFGLLYFIGGVGRGLITPLLMANAIRRTPPIRRGTSMGIFQSIYSIGMFLGPQLMGILIAHFNDKYVESFHIMGLLAVVAAGLTFLLPISTEEIT